jgi:hypothetical protein
VYPLFFFEEVLFSELEITIEELLIVFVGLSSNFNIDATVALLRKLGQVPLQANQIIHIFLHWLSVLIWHVVFH